MITRITNQMMSAQVLANVNSVQDQLSHTEEQLSSGKRINQPSDDPYGASLAVQLHTDLSGLQNYQNNITDATAWLQAAGASLTNITSMIQRAQELVVQAANGTQSSGDRQASAAELSQLTDAIKQEANTQYNGQYIFSGNATATAPYAAASGDVYQGNTGPVTRQISPGSAMQVNTGISALLGSGSGANDGKLLDTLRAAAAAMTSGSAASVSTLSSTTLSSLASSLDTVTQMQANVGASQNRLTYASERIQSLQSSDTAALSNDEDVNMASAMTSYSSLQAAFTAALRAGANIVQSSLMDFLKG